VNQQSPQQSPQQISADKITEQPLTNPELPRQPRLFSTIKELNQTVSFHGAQKIEQAFENAASGFQYLSIHSSSIDDGEN
jgi:hypothetical protein